MAKAAVKEKEIVEPTNIIVVSTLNRAHGIVVSTRIKTYEEAKAAAKNEETRNDLHDSSLTVWFISGANFFTGKKLEEYNFVKEHPDFKKMVNEGTLRVIDASAAKIKNGGDAPESIVSIDSGPTAISLVEGTMDVELLRTWQDEETRESVKDAIRAQIKLVSEFDKVRAAAQAIA